MLQRKELDQIRDKSKTELLKDIKATEQEIVELRMKKFRGTMTNVHQIRNLRKKAAQLKTMLNQKDAS